jgi:hypothetical protein
MLEYSRRATNSSIRGSRIEVTMVVTGARLGGSMKLEITPGGGGPKGTFVRSTTAIVIRWLKKPVVITESSTGGRLISRSIAPTRVLEPSAFVRFDTG